MQEGLEGPVLGTNKDRNQAANIFCCGLDCSKGLKGGGTVSASKTGRRKAGGVQDNMCYQQCHVAPGDYLGVAFVNRLRVEQAGPGLCWLAGRL